MRWEIEGSDQFSSWFNDLSLPEAQSVAVAVDTLSRDGPKLGRPQVDTLEGSSIPNLKELRVQHAGRPLRILFAFDPRRVGYLILGGDKTGNKNWYRTFIPIAEKIYKQHLKEIQR